MATNGLDDTISKLDAAFALVWVNREEKTLNFIRNKERPLAFARLDNGAFVWASEREMLEWIINRERGISFAKAKGEVALWDLPEYTHLTIPFTGRTMGTPKLKVLPKPTFPEYNWSGRWGIGTGTDADYEDWWNGRTSSTRTVHEAPARETQRYETMYQRRARECVEKICSSGNVGSWIEVEFLGHQHERSYSGFESSISLFKYRSWVKPNLEFIFHSFNHAGCLTKDWTDADIGKRLYGRVAGANPINEASYKCIRNEALGYTLGVESLTETRPPKIYSYYEEGAAIEEGKNIVPFQSKGQRRKQAKRGKKEQGRFKSELTDDGGPEDSIFSYADGQRVSYNQFHRDRADNQGRCACCAHQLPTAGISGVHLIQWYNEEDNTTERMLACSPECAREVIDLCAEMDAEYEDHKRSGESQ